MDIKELRSWAETEAQTNTIDAVIAANGNMRQAARDLGVHHSNVQKIIARVERKATEAVRQSRLGNAPGHFEGGVAAGYVMGKVTVQRGGDGVVERTWERQHPDDLLRQQAMEAALRAMVADIVPLDPQPASYGPTDSDKLNLFPITDYHMGMLAWSPEAGADWDLSIAENLLYKSFERLIINAPDAETAVIAQLGDFLHFDGLKAITPEHGNLLDADTRFPKLVEAVIRVLRRVVDLALETHDHVHVIMAEGNHDMVSSIWLRAMFSALYSNEPRVTVDNTPYPYYIYVHGETLLAFHHGHLAKNASLPGLFAARFRKEWGLTTRAFIYTGHRHHEDLKEFPGAKVHQLPTMAAADAYAARGGWLSEREFQRWTFDKKHGRIGSEIVTPDMFVVD